MLSATGSFAVASAAATVAFWAVTAAPFVLSYVAADRQRKALANARSLVNDDRVLQQAIPSSAPEHRLLLGYAHTAGTPFFVRGGEAYRPYLYKGLLLAAHECDGLDSVWINGTRIYIDPVSGEATATPFNDGTTSFIRVSFRSGTLDQTIDPILDEIFTSLPSTYRQRGQCTAVIEAHYGTGANRDAQDDLHRTLYGDGEFQPVFRVRGAKVYDPRSPSQTLADESSYTWSRNAALNIAHYLRWKYRDMADRIDWDEVAAAADIADELKFDKNGNVFRQYTLDGAVLSSDPVPDALTDLLSSCNGRLIRRAGKFYPYPAQVERAIGTLHKGNLRGAIQYHNGLPKGQLVNEIRPEFMSPERGYKIVPGPVLTDSDAVTADGELRSRSVRYPFTETSARMQRLAQQELREGRQQETATVGVDISALRWVAGRVINVDLADFLPQLTGTWRIERKAWSDGLNGYVLELRKYAATMMEFDPANDEQDFEVDEDVAA